MATTLSASNVGGNGVVQKGRADFAVKVHWRRAGVGAVLHLVQRDDERGLFVDDGFRPSFGEEQDA